MPSAIARSLIPFLMLVIDDIGHPNRRCASWSLAGPWAASQARYAAVFVARVTAACFAAAFEHSRESAVRPEYGSVGGGAV